MFSTTHTHDGVIQSSIQFHKIMAKLHNKGDIQSYDIILYNIIRRLPLTRGFTTPINTIKVANGATIKTILNASVLKLYWLSKNPELFNTRYGSLPSAELTEYLYQLTKTGVI